MTELDKSAHGKTVSNFRTLAWKSSNYSTNKLSRTFWSIKTPNRKNTIIKYLKIKVLLGQASLLETRCLYDAPGVLSDRLFVSALRAFQSGISRDILMQRIKLLQRLMNLPEWSMNLYYTLNNSVSYELREIEKTIRRVKKYSGYVRNSSAVGSKKSRDIFIPEPEIVEWNIDREIDFYYFLTVGEFDSGLPGSWYITLMSPKEDETGYPSKL